MSTLHRSERQWTVGSIATTMQLLLLFLYVLSTAVCSTEGATCDPGDSAALLDFKAGFIDNGQYFSDWQNVNGRNCCSWAGVTCNDAGRVESLIIDATINPPTKNPNYTGVVGGSLGRLSQLDELLLTNVKFNGSAPESLSQLSLLKSLRLSGDSSSTPDSFQGPIPASYGRLTNLTQVDFSSAGFSGSIPRSFCNWVHILNLDFSRNFLTGPIPDCIYRWTEVLSLFLNDNRLSGPIPRSIGALSKLVFLLLQNNTLTGPIPKTMRRLSSLVDLEMNQNKLTGHIPSSLGSITTLFTLILSQNALSGTIPSELANLGNLHTLDLGDNQLVGGIPPELANTSFSVILSTIRLYGNRLTGCLPAFGALDELDVSHNSLSCSLPTNLGPFGLFRANNNFFTGNLPSTLAATGRDDITAGGVDLSYNRLSGFGPASDLPSTGPPYRIAVLYLRHNIITAPIPTYFGDFPLYDVDLSLNLISGGIPTFLIRGYTVKYYDYNRLNISYNILDGGLPTEEFTSHLHELDASHNKLTGPISENFVHGLNSLSYLDLSYNNLTGRVPSDIITFPRRTALEYVNLQHNDFTGPVPSYP